MTSLKTSIKTITYLSDIGCLEIQGASLTSKKNAGNVTTERNNAPMLSCKELMSINDVSGYAPAIRNDILDAQIKCNKAWKLDYSDLTEAEKTNVTNANSNAGRVASKLKKYSVNPHKKY